jgi:phosphatidylserine/phosphatidylglycerophosphate/cardiolipin synthase-like enzyme
MKHAEKFHIDEVTRTAKGTVQWFLDKRNKPEDHPITHNNQLKLFICGEEGFASIAADIENAKESIDLCCWGFDPGMELIRADSLWPRGVTFGDLLIAAGERGVRVRLLVWLHPKLATAGSFYGTGFVNPKNLPGWTHDTFYFGLTLKNKAVSEINAHRTLARHRDPYLKRAGGHTDGIALNDQIAIADKARKEYCCNWFRTARGMNGRFKNISVAYREADTEAIKRNLASETGRIDNSEFIGFTQAGSHHQKTILIDYAHQDGANAVGYVMGLNSVTDYWDTVDHKIEDGRREWGDDREEEEAVQALNPDDKTDPGFRSYKPYRDYACRFEGGGALIAVSKNFESAWLRATVPADNPARTSMEKEIKETAVPSKLLRPARKKDASVQIVRTQPEEDDKTIKELYFQATDTAAATGGYIYIENQYFQYEEWTQRLVQQCKAKAALWRSAAAKSGKSMEDMPVLHVFVVAPVAERDQMVPRTYDTLATIGQHGGMKGQQEMIDKETAKGSKSDVVDHGNKIKKPTVKQLEADGLRVVASMLQVSDNCRDLKGKIRMRYREIYIHSKLLLTNDSFFSLGSANLNKRSMSSDSEMNFGTNDRTCARYLRQNIWQKLSGNEFDGGQVQQHELKLIFDRWGPLQLDNREKKQAGKRMQGFLLPFEDNRNSTIRLG